MESTDQLSETARGAINSTGGRMTAQRAALLAIIQEANEHLDAEEIHRRARERGEKVSLSTVYRTLGLLKELNLVDELHLWDEHHHYESRTVEEHCHLLCRVCGSVTEVSGPAVSRMKETAAGDSSFFIEHTQMDFVGVCASCQKKGEVRSVESEAGQGGEL